MPDAAPDLAHWNYRVLRHEDGSLALHEVFYDSAGRPASYTSEPVGFAAHPEEGVLAIESSLEMALKDIRQAPVLTPADFPRPDEDDADA